MAKDTRQSESLKYQVMSNNTIERRFIDAVNAYIASTNRRLRARGSSKAIPVVEYLASEEDDLLTRFSEYCFPNNTPYRHFFFLDEFKENNKYIAFGENINYNDIYLIDKVSGEVLDFSEEEEIQFKCANSFESFLEAFILLIKLETEINNGQEINDPIERLKEIIQVAGGEGYRGFYEFIFPIDIPELMN